MRLAEARVVGVADELINWRAVAVGGVKVAERVEAHAERIHLPEGELLNARTVRLQSVRVAGIHRDAQAVCGSDGCVVVEAVREVQPAVEPASKRRVHAVRVPLVPKRPVQFLALVGPAVAVGVAQKPDVRDAPGDHAILVRVKTGRDVEAVCEQADLVVRAIAAGVLEHLDRVATGLAKRRGVRILQRACDPQPAALVKGEVHRLANVRAGRDQLHPETIRDSERLEAFPRGERIRLAHQHLKIRSAVRITALLETLRLAKHHASQAIQNEARNRVHGLLFLLILF